MLNDTTAIAEQSTSRVTPKSQELFQLMGKFMMSNTPLMIIEGTHEFCLSQAKIMIEFLKREHICHRTGYEFKESLVGTDIIMVNGSRPEDRFPKSRLWMTLEIRRKIIRSDYDSIPGSKTDIDLPEQRHMSSLNKLNVVVK